MSNLTEFTSYIAFPIGVEKDALQSDFMHFMQSQVMHQPRHQLDPSDMVRLPDKGAEAFPQIRIIPLAECSPD